MKLTTLAIPFVIMAQGYTLTILHQNGEKTEISTDDIQKIEFVNNSSEVPDDTRPQLAEPSVVFRKNSPDAMTFNWSKVDNATYYSYAVDGGAATTTTATTATVEGLTGGNHTFEIKACSVSPAFRESNPVVISFATDIELALSLEEATKNSITVSVSLNTPNDTYSVAVTPMSAAANPQERVAYAKANPAECQVSDYTGTDTNKCTFSGLAHGTDYTVIAYVDGSDIISTLTVKTKDDYKVGEEGSVFPKGVSPQGGFVDIDKLRVNPWYVDDSNMCYACSAACMMAWWIQDYKRVTGKDYPVAIPIQEETHYSTPVMDIYCQAWNYDAAGGDCYDACLWFAAGVQQNFILNGVNALVETYPHWKGGFLGMTREEAMKMFYVQDETFGYSEPRYNYYIFDPKMENLPAEEFAEAFSEQAIRCLEQGPFYIGTGNHAIVCWGADYTVNANGAPKIHHLWIAENSGNAPENVQNGLNYAPVVYDKGRVMLKIESLTMYGWDGEIRKTFGIRSYEYMQ